MSLLSPDIDRLLSEAPYLHLATASVNARPHVSLMHYLYLRPGQAVPFESGPIIAFSTARDTQKFDNLEQNPHVSLLIHDWVTASVKRRDSLSDMLKEINQSEISSLSVTLSGRARVLDNTQDGFFRAKLAAAHDHEHYLNPSTAIVVVQIDEATVADPQNNVRTFTVA